MLPTASRACGFRGADLRVGSRGERIGRAHDYGEQQETLQYQRLDEWIDGEPIAQPRHVRNRRRGDADPVRRAAARVVEGNETIVATLERPLGASLADAVGVGTMSVAAASELAEARRSAPARVENSPAT